MSDQPKTPLQEITQPFIDFIRAPRALWGINLAYVLEGMVYFGMLGYLAIHFSSFIFQSVDGADDSAHFYVGMLTAGITIAMFFLGFVADKKGVRFALIAAFMLMLMGRVLWSGAPNVLGMQPTRPGVFVGDLVTLQVDKVDIRHGVPTITKATVLEDDDGTSPGGGGLALDLAAGEGTAPSAELASRLVQLGSATITDGEETTWTIEYGSKPVTAHLFAPAADGVGLCKGAVITVKEGYIGYWQEKEKWVIRTHWLDDFGPVDRSACEKDARPDEAVVAERAEEIRRRESTLRAEQRQPAAGMDDVDTGSVVTLAELAAYAEGEPSPTGLLKDVYVTYVRNGGYFVQADAGGPAMAVFVNPVGSSLHIVTLIGMMLVVIGYGMYQPAAYAGVRQFTTPKTAAMGFAMLYALMNLGGWLPSFAFLLRDDDFLGLGIPGTYWVYTCFTLIALVCTIFILSSRTVKEATARAQRETEEIKKAEAAKKAAVAESVRATSPTAPPTEPGSDAPPTEPASAKAPPIPELAVPGEEKTKSVPVHMWVFVAAVLAAIIFRVPAPANVVVATILGVAWVVLALIPVTAGVIARHPLADGKFFFFIFALIPVQTLFTYNWLILPQYINRAFDGWIGEYFEVAANANPLLIFILVPMITAVTQKAKVYNMMIWGTLIMAAPAFLLWIGPYWWTLFAYLLIMTIGEAMWQPRFLQYAAEIAPKGRTGMYMGVAQLPWFMTKMLVPWLYSGWMMDRYCPAEGPKDTQTMWLYFGFIAICSTIMLILAKGWLGKDFKTQADD